MCQSCIEIDNRIEEHRKRLKTADASEIKRVNELIAQLYAERVRSHQNPQD
jgi:hypothetical protein